MTGPPHCLVKATSLWRYLVSAFAFVILGCAPSARLRLLMNMPEAQKAPFELGVIRPFEKKAHCRVELATYASIERLLDSLSRLPDSLQPDLIELPDEMALPLAHAGLVKPMEGRLSATQMQSLKGEFFFPDLGRLENRQWFWPRHLETPLLLFLKSRVVQASRFWDLRQAEINRDLKKLGVAEIGGDYTLEADPRQWDQLDLFVAASFWKQQELGGRRRARVSLGLGSPHDVMLALMNRSLQLGAGSEDLLRLDDDKVQAALRWQQAFCREDLLRSGSYRGETLDSLAPAMRAGEVYAVEVTPREAFLAHGNGTQQLPGYLSQPEDMGIAPLPKALWPDDLRRVSGPGQESGRGAATRLWLWGFGKGRGDPAKVAALLEHLSSTSSLVFEASNFGLLPARRDVLSELPLIFGGGWAGNIFQAAAQQMIENGQARPPRVESFSDIAQLWHQASQEICRKSESPATITEVQPFSR